jgi:hypothetical protein
MTEAASAGLGPERPEPPQPNPSPTLPQPMPPDERLPSSRYRLYRIRIQLRTHPGQRRLAAATSE